MEASALTFAEPGWFLALLLVPLFAGLYFWSQRRNDALIAKIIAPRLRDQLAGAVSRGMRAFRALLILAALALIVVALARPQKGFIEREITQRGRDVIIAVDTSRSMLATDVSPTRLARAKLLAQDIMRLVPGDRVGLIAFAGSSFLQAPLTLDHSAVLNSLDELDTTIIPKGGTNIAAAIREAEAAFGKGEGQTRALIILTDGEELDADGIAAAKKAASMGVRIFTVGIGSTEGSLIPIRAEGGGSDFVRDMTGKPVQSRLDESRLKEIAAASGGFFEPLGPEAARTIFEKGILPMEESNSALTTARQPVERYQWPLGAAVGLLSLWMIIGDRRRHHGVSLRPATAAIILLAAISSAQAQSGLDAYQAGDYSKAMEDFSKKLQTSPDSDKLQFNAGTAAYKMGDYGKAVDHFTKAILSSDNKLREEASYNLGNALVRRGEAAKGNEEKKSDWKNAIQHYTTALDLQPDDKQAKENRDIVKKMLEDLEKQEQQQKNQDQQKQDKKDQKDQKKQDQKQQQQQQQNPDNKDKKDQSEQNKDQQKQDQKDQQNNDQKNNDQKDNKGQQGDNSQKQDQSGGDKKDDQKQDQQPQGGGGQQKQDDKKDQPQDQKQDQKPSSQGDQQKDQQPSQGGQNQPQQGDQQKDQQQGGQPQPTPTPGEKKQGDLKSSGAGNEQKDQQQGGAAGEAEAAEEQKDGQMTAGQARSLLNSLKGDEERVNLMQRQETQDTLKDW